MSKVHVWVGINNDEDFFSYFELDYSNPDIDIDDPNYKVCQFCKDINEKWYDEDFIGVYVEDELKDVTLYLEELCVSKETLLEIQKICVEKKLEKVNAMFYYMDPDIVINDTEKLYNKLTYIGKFNS
ncbi:immunity 22 family protein [Lysinibacillus xylanilyticus]|uniref:immunity 22 family protein n=1 Tax=Lysinibacillus xylanilyticus TaxID=582475 RepID=UPI003CFC8967